MEGLELNERQRKIMLKFLDGGFGELLNTSKYKGSAGCSADTANRDLVKLTELGLLQKRGKEKALPMLRNKPHEPIGGGSSRLRIVCVLETLYIDFHHLQHRLSDFPCLERIRIAEQLHQSLGNDLPGYAEFVFEPAAL